MIVLDTGVLYAATDRDDARHGDSSRLVLRHLPDLVVPLSVLVESSWLVQSRLGSKAEAQFLAAVARGELRAVEMAGEDWHRVAELTGQYADLGLGLVDASVVATAERLGITVVATLNHRDFRVVRPRHCEALTLVP